MLNRRLVHFYINYSYVYGRIQGQTFWPGYFQIYSAIYMLVAEIRWDKMHLRLFLFCFWEGSRHFLCLVFDSSVARIKNWTQKDKIPRENKSSSLNAFCLIPHLSSQNIASFLSFFLKRLTWIQLNSTITQILFVFIVA